MARLAQVQVHSEKSTNTTLLCSLETTEIEWKKRWEGSLVWDFGGREGTVGKEERKRQTIFQVDADCHLVIRFIHSCSEV